MSRGNVSPRRQAGRVAARVRPRLGRLRVAGSPLFYVAIILTVVRSNWPVTAIVAVGAGVLAGPTMPAGVSSRLVQGSGAWALWLALFVMIGVLVAFLIEKPETMLRSRLRDAAVSARLLRALERGDVEAFYQPIYRVGDGRLVGLEALVRWRKSNGEYASPSTFIPPAERTGAIALVDEHVLGKAVAEAAGWPALAQSVFVSVNLSAATLARPHLVAKIEGLLSDAGLPARLLQVEITESAHIEDLPDAVRRISSLRALGVKVAIDDFGSGHASLNYLQCLPVDVVKLDRTLVTAVTSDVRRRRLLVGVNQMCDLLGLQVIAEGVELHDQLVCLSDIGIAMAQGFLLGRPVPVGEVRDLIGESGPR